MDWWEIAWESRCGRGELKWKNNESVLQVVRCKENKEPRYWKRRKRCGRLLGKKNG